MTFAQTQEQEQILAAFETKLPTKVNAFAGTGKTTSMEFIARSTQRTGTYFAFNKSTADDARARFPTTVLCKTMHALAFGPMARRYPTAKMTSNLNGGRAAAALNLTPKQLTKDIFLSARGWGFLVADAAKNYMRSGDDAVMLHHVRLPPAFDAVPVEVRGAAKTMLFRDAVKLWEKMIDPNADVPLTHDGYLKLWALGRPRIPGEYHILDEAQDTNAVVMRLLQHQSAQIIAVGDRWQNIYAWRGSLNAMQAIDVAHETRLTKSWRFGLEIAENASRILRCLKEPVPLVGNEAVKSRVGVIEEDPDVFLARTNATCIAAVMDEIDKGRRPALVGGVTALLAFVDAAEGLMAGCPSDHEDLIGFQTWDDVRIASDGAEGAELRVMVRTIDQYGPAKLKRALTGLPREQDASLVISTAHKSKGREWKRVRLADDFLRGFKDAKPAEKQPASVSEAELMLFYVASTRARLALEVPGILQDRIRDLEAALEPAKTPEPAIG
jgi:hypothetical protein